VHQTTPDFPDEGLHLIHLYIEAAARFNRLVDFFYSRSFSVGDVMRMR
jgi:hypothetical protein